MYVPSYLSVLCTIHNKTMNYSAILFASPRTVCLNERELLSKLFKDLVQRSQHPRCIDKATFCRVFPLPGVLGNRLFKVFDTNCNELIGRDQWFNGMGYVLLSLSLTL